MHDFALKNKAASGVMHACFFWETSSRGSVAVQECSCFFGKFHVSLEVFKGGDVCQVAECNKGMNANATWRQRGI